MAESGTREDRGKRPSQASQASVASDFENIESVGVRRKVRWTEGDEFKDARHTIPRAKPIIIDPIIDQKTDLISDGDRIAPNRAREYVHDAESLCLITKNRSISEWIVNGQKIITLRFLDDIAPYKRDEVAGIGEDEAHRLLNMNTPKKCELMLSQEDREHFNNALKSLVKEYPLGEILRRGVTIDDVAAQSNLTRTEVVALLDASGWAPKNMEEEPRIWFNPIRNLFSKIGKAKRPLNAGVISDLKSSGYTEQTVNDLFNTFIGGKIGQLAHYRYGAEASTAAN